MGLGMAIHLSLAWLKSLGNRCQPFAIKILLIIQKIPLDVMIGRIEGKSFIEGFVGRQDRVLGEVVKTLFSLRDFWLRND